MDFFQHQDDARRRSGRLVLFFVLAVLALLVGLNLAAAFAIASQGGAYTAGAAAAVTLGGAAVIGLGTLFRLASLRGGGRVVAEGLGGRLLAAGGTLAPKERQLLNIVEEMAIAAGAPVPAVYLMPAEEGINAFAAGWSGADAVIGVTQGALDKLSRDELQGVVAHEFSHLIHGDARLNVRLMGVLFGILLLGLIGEMLLRSMRFSGRSSRRQGGNAVVVVVAVGAALMVLGYAGTFFGDLIKAAVSRQREFLADASAVQYTRNPLGIAGALMKIGGLREGSSIAHRNAPEASHLFFGAGTRRSRGGMFATHPPLEERVVRLVPSLAGRLSKAFAGDRAAMSALQHGAAGLAQLAPEVSVPPPARTAVEHIGDPTPEHVDEARKALASVPDELRTSAGDPFGAQALVHALLLAPAGATRTLERRVLAAALPPQTMAEVERRSSQLAALPPAARHAVLELALAGLATLSEGQRATLLAQVDRVVQADGRITAYESTIRQLVAERATAAADRRPAGAVRLANLDRDVALLLRLLADAGARDRDESQRALDAGWRELGRAPVTAQEGDPRESLARLARLTPDDRRRVVRAAAAVIEADGRLVPEEVELFRLVAEALGAPVPPLLAGQGLLAPAGGRAR